MKTSFFVTLATLLLLGDIAAANPVIRCVQRALVETGNDPRGIDGIIGRRTLGAAESWSETTDIELPDLSNETAPQWCSTLLVETDGVPSDANGTEQFCSGFDEVLSGVWLFPNGAPALGFRYSSNADGSGCYAWMNAAQDWQISSAGNQIMSVERNGEKRAWGAEPNGIFVDLETGVARYVQNGFTTYGVLIE